MRLPSEIKVTKENKDLEINYNHNDQTNMIQNINELKDDSIKSPIHLEDLDSESDDDYDENSKYSKCLWFCKKKLGI